MEVLIQVLIAMSLIALMIVVRMVSSHAIFQFRMNNGFRAHECDGTCRHHAADHAVQTDQTEEIA